VRPGSLLALPSSLDIGLLQLKTIPAVHLAWTLQNYGLYLVDDSYWDAIALETELSPSGRYTDQFQSAWGFPFQSNSNAWSSDIKKIFSHLSVVSNWDVNVYNSVIESNGQQGAGGGIPLQQWAPPFSDSQCHSSIP
jgi:hypothetical protein